MDGAVKAVRSGGVEQASVRPRIELRDVAGPVALECCIPARRIVPGDIVRNQRVVPPRYGRSNRYSSHPRHHHRRRPRGVVEPPHETVVSTRIRAPNKPVILLILPPRRAESMWEPQAASRHRAGLDIEMSGVCTASAKPGG